MASSCCMSRKNAPSPDGLAPRPATKPASMTGDGPQKSFGTGSTVTILSKATDIADLSTIFNPDTLSLAGSKHSDLKSKKSAATIKVVTLQDRLRKHISRESGILNHSKRNSRASIGTSEEEVERRAELRRLQKKRILDELSADDGYDEDAKFIQTTPAPDSRRATWVTSDFRRLMAGSPTPPEPPKLTEPETKENPVVLFDTHIFSPTENVDLPRPRSESNLIDLSQNGCASSNHLSRRHSSAGNFATQEKELNVHGRRHNSVVPIPSSPTLSAVRMPSITEPAMHSTWRLSYSVPNRGQELRKLSSQTSLRTTSSPLPNWTSIPLPTNGSTRATSPFISPRPLNRWLHSQGLRSPSQAVSLDDDSSCIVIPAQPAAGSTSGDLGGVDGSSPDHDSGLVVHLRELSISRRLAASKGPYSPSISPPESLREIASHTRAPSSLAIPLKSHQSRTTLDSSMVSETESHRHIESELRVVKSRFAASEIVRTPSTPRSSKFREEFEPKESEPLMPESPSSTPRRRSTKATLTRIAKLAMRSYDGPMEKMLGVPIMSPEKRQRSKSRSPSKTPLDDEGTLGAWGIAVKDIKSKDLSSGERKKSLWRRPSRQPSQGTSTKEVNGNQGTTYDRLMHKKDDMMDDWEMEMEQTAQKAKAKSKKITQKVKTGPDLRYPEAWSKFPSHTREGRILAAGNEIGIAAKDFAVHEMKESGTVWFQEERRYHELHYPGGEHGSHQLEARKSFFRELEDKFKDQLLKQDDYDKGIVINQTFGRRGSTVLGAELEFPELEMLSTEMMSSAEIEAHVQEQIRQEEMDYIRAEALKKKEAEEAELRRKEDELDEIFGRRKKKPLSTIQKARIAAEEAKAEAAEESGSSAKKSGTKRRLKTTEIPEKSPVKSPGKKGISASNMANLTGETPQVATLMAMEKEAVVEEEEAEKPDTAGMNESVMEQQIKARMELKEKIEARRKVADGRRGPVARKKSEDPPAPVCPTIERVASPASGMDGSEDEGETTIANSGIASSQISIADPRYYADCIAARIFTPSPPPNEDADSDASSSSWDGRNASATLPRKKFGTWSGKNRYKYSELTKSPRMVKSYANLEMRKSTDAFGREVEKEMERARQMAIMAAKAAWGSSES